MSLKQEKLLFDKEVVLEDDILEHVQHYYDLADKGMKLLESNRSEAMNCLKETRKTMSSEYEYYTKRKLQNIMWNNNLYSKYYHFIQDAFVKQDSPRSYKKLSSNLYGVCDYAKHYYRKNLKMR